MTASNALFNTSPSRIDVSVDDQGLSAAGQTTDHAEVTGGAFTPAKGPFGSQGTKRSEKRSEVPKRNMKEGKSENFRVARRESANNGVGSNTRVHASDKRLPSPSFAQQLFAPLWLSRPRRATSVARSLQLRVLIVEVNAREYALLRVSHRAKQSFWVLDYRPAGERKDDLFGRVCHRLNEALGPSARWKAAAPGDDFMDAVSAATAG